MKTNKLINSLLVSTLALTIGGGSLTAFAADSATELTGKGTVQFEKSKEVTGPIDPEEPGKPVEPEDKDDIKVNPTKGDLNLDLVSNFDFKTISDYKVSTKEEVYPAEAITLTNGDVRGNWVQVTDERAGEAAGWRITAKMESEFTNATSKTLPGAYITLSNQNVLSDFTAPTANAETVKLAAGADAATVINAAAGTGNGTTTVEFGTSDTANGAATMHNSVNLHVLPGTGVEEGSAYTTDITWTLEEI